jgi:hypothetical protein
VNYLESTGGYLDKVNAATNYRRTLGRVQSLVGQDVMPGALAKQAEASPIKWGVGTAAGAVAGGIIGVKHGHWLIGALAGGSLFTNVPHVLNATTRSEALWNMAQVATGSLASLRMPENKAIGFVLGWAIAGIARLYLETDK